MLIDVWYYIYPTATHLSRFCRRNVARHRDSLSRWVQIPRLANLEYLVARATRANRDMFTRCKKHAI